MWIQKSASCKRDLNEGELTLNICDFLGKIIKIITKLMELSYVFFNERALFSFK